MMNRQEQSDSSVLCAGRRMFQAGGNPARPPSKRGLKPKAGVTPRRAWLTSREEDKLELAMVYGDGEMCAEQETLGMCARRLRVVDSNEWNQLVREVNQAGQGVHREVGSEGFAVNHRAVAEQGEPVGQNSGENRAGSMAAKEILGAPGCIKVCAGGTVAKEHAVPREVSYGPALTRTGTWTYKPKVKSSGTLCEKSE